MRCRGGAEPRPYRVHRKGFPYEGEAIGKQIPRTYRPGGYFYDSAFLYTHAFGSGRPPV